MKRLILPYCVLGKSSTNSIADGTLYLSKFLIQKDKISVLVIFDLSVVFTKSFSGAYETKESLKRNQ
mgnify:CR=1 FL=1